MRAQRVEPVGEGGGVGQGGERAGEAQLAAGERGAQLVAGTASRKRRESTRTGRKKPGRTGDPACLVGRDAAAGDDAVQVRVVVQRLAPGVQHGERADLGAEVAGIGGDVAQRLGRGAEQDGVDHRLVVERDLGDRRRQR